MVIISKVDILAIGAHPDDVETGAGGLLSKFIKLGFTAGIVDLTAGEMATNGNPAERRREALRATEIMGLPWRKCLGIPDRGIQVNRHNIMLLVQVIRESRPKLILCPYWEERHPDHVNACQLVKEAYFDAGLRKIESNWAPFRPQQIWYYFLSRAGEPKLIVDITDVYNIKKAALAAHVTQFGRQTGRWDTFLNTGPGSLMALVESRDRYFGSLIGCMYGEGFTMDTPLAIKNPVTLLEVKE
ncbi:LmbE family protein [Desulfotomaculum nigrificans CO-1-SRB]|uniref:LmbE family protein n=1 Tax=Desulfotomaculum nigrificans (strain DSM 14880 / VKM B-2319 / CO-1-SRB) TaxID=868595 RepID=F6B7K4_DESCC|nr:bacillithiol biosynthesis deacetylase BshB1 [Desulfotomaculum nigrificans]AEF94558.1 LmbE family protein [Desulfotomaculum nigrificans CO-1-SRB]